jgi:CDP-diacylglycerol--glycerol-3-phosphate 3-phosphatidyltransferase
MSLGLPLAATGAVDLVCGCAVITGAGGFALAYALRGTGGRQGEHFDLRARTTSIPDKTCDVAGWAAAPVVDALVRARVSANAITTASLLAGVVVGPLLAVGHFGVAGLVFVLASVGDALDGMVARASRSTSTGGALFDATVDRYEEFFALAGLAVHFRESGPLLTLVLAALLGTFMVSYGSALAESYRVAVPAGLMRRPERAVCLGCAFVVSPAAAYAARRAGLVGFEDLFGDLPVVLALLTIGVVANASAVARVRAIATATRSPRARAASVRDATPQPTRRAA